MRPVFRALCCQRRRGSRCGRPRRSGCWGLVDRDLQALATTVLRERSAPRGERARIRSGLAAAIKPIHPTVVEMDVLRARVLHTARDEGVRHAPDDVFVQAVACGLVPRVPAGGRRRAKDPELVVLAPLPSTPPTVLQAEPLVSERFNSIQNSRVRPTPLRGRDETAQASWAVTSMRHGWPLVDATGAAFPSVPGSTFSYRLLSPYRVQPWIREAPETS